MVPHIFYQTPRFPSDLAFSTPWDPVPHTRIFQLSKENRNTAPLLHMTAHTFHVTKLVGLIESDWFIPNGWQICINFTQECVTECSQADILECVLVLTPVFLLKLILIFGLVSFKFGSYGLSLIQSVLIFHDLPWPTPKFHDFPDLENEIMKFHDFPGFPWPVRTLRNPHQKVTKVKSKFLLILGQLNWALTNLPL